MNTSGIKALDMAGLIVEGGAASKGRPRINGTHITLSALTTYWEMGMTDEWIIKHYSKQFPLTEEILDKVRLFLQKNPELAESKSKGGRKKLPAGEARNWLVHIRFAEGRETLIRKAAKTCKYTATAADNKANPTVSDYIRELVARDVAARAAELA